MTVNELKLEWTTLFKKIQDAELTDQEFSDLCGEIQSDVEDALAADDLNLDTDEDDEDATDPK